MGWLEQSAEGFAMGLRYYLVTLSAFGFVEVRRLSIHSKSILSGSHEDAQFETEVSNL